MHAQELLEAGDVVADEAGSVRPAPQPPQRTDSPHAHAELPPRLQKVLGALAPSHAPPQLCRARSADVEGPGSRAVAASPKSATHTQTAVAADAGGLAGGGGNAAAAPAVAHPDAAANVHAVLARAQRFKSVPPPLPPPPPPS